MKKILLAAALVLVAQPALAKKDMTPLTPAAAAALQGKTFVVTRHKRPSYSAMTAGKAMFGLFGAGAMIAAGNKILEDNNVADPAALISEELAKALAAKYGLTRKPAQPEMIDVDKPKQIAATQAAAGADYVLDVQSTGFMSAYYPGDWNSYWIAYSVDVRLVDAKGNQLAQAGCFATTNKHPNSPTQAQMHGYGAQLFKDVTQAHGWTCLHLLGTQEFLLADDALPATPAQYVDPLKLYAETHSAFPTEPATAAPAATEAPAATDVPAAPAPTETAPAETAPAEGTNGH